MDSTQKAHFAEALDGARQHVRLGRLDEAAVLLRGALQVCPDSPDAHQLLGLVLSQQGLNDEAISEIRAALAYVDDQPALWANLGTALLGANRAEEAIVALHRAIALRPDHANTLCSLSAACRQAGQLDEAVVTAAKAIEILPGHAGAWNHLGLAMRAKGRYDDAVLALDRALQLRDDTPGVWANYAWALLAAGRTEDALAASGMAVSKSGGAPAMLETHASLLIHAGRPGEASRILDDVLKALPDRASARVNHGLACLELGDFDEALADFRTVIDRGDPTGEARSNASLALLLKGEFDEGWALHEYRWSRPGASPRRPFEKNFPRWRGEPLAGRRLLVWGEQGIGDEIMFAGCLSALASQADVTVECDARLVPLLGRSLEHIDVIGRDDPPVADLVDAAPDLQIPMGSLPLHLRPDREPPRPAYLYAPQEQVDALRASYGRDAFCVGISWHSGNAQEGPKRSVPLDAWGAVFGTPGARFVSLQYGDHAPEIARARDMFGVEIIDDATVDPLADMDRFAAQVAAMDLVISIDNSTVHLAGSLGVETWALLPFVPDWRWGAAGEQSFWYGSVRLLRQAGIGGFGSLIEQVAVELGEKISATPFSAGG